MKDNLNLTGMVKTQHFNSNMELIEEREFPNLVVTTGKNFVASRMNGTSQNVMSHIAIGQGNTAANVTDIGLVSEIARVAMTTATVSNNSITYSATFGTGLVAAITEAAIFNSATLGVMLARTVFATLNKATGDTVVISWTITNS